MTNQTRVLIAGSGPSVAYALLACRSVGIEPEVLSERPPHTDQAGAFFLHWLPPELDAPPIPVIVTCVGNESVYSTKQWGCIVPTSWQQGSRTEQWYSSECLARAWDGTNLLPSRQLDDRTLSWFGNEYDWVFYTFSAQVHALHHQLVQFPTLVRQLEADQRNGLVFYSGEETCP